MARFHIHTLGCKVNRAESETIAAALMARGWEQTDALRDSDVIILNTCTVTGEADAKNRKALHSLLRKARSPILVTGCAVNINADFYADLDERIVCEKDKALVVQRAAELACDYRKDVASDMEIARLRSGDAFRTRVDVKIQDGCDNACSYCIVHTARGPARSVPAEQVLEEARALAETGTRELVLVGIDLAAYEDDGRDLAWLVDEIAKRTSAGRVRVSSVEPQSVTPRLIDALGRSDGRLCRHLHLCLQSGSSKVLREMNRRYDADGFESLVRQLRSACPPLALSTDVIVGFPGETDDDFERTCSLVESCGFMRLHVFKYSRRAGTPAAERADQVDPRVKAKRSEKLIALGRDLALADMQRRVGTTEQVVIERPGLGASESYHTVSCDTSIPVGSLVPLAFTDIDASSLHLIAR